MVKADGSDGAATWLNHLSTCNQYRGVKVQAQLLKASLKGFVTRLLLQSSSPAKLPHAPNPTPKALSPKP